MPSCARHRLSAIMLVVVISIDNLSPTHVPGFTARARDEVLVLQQTILVYA